MRARQGSESRARERGSHTVRSAPFVPRFVPIRFGVLLVDGITPEVRELFDRLIQDDRTRIIALSHLDRDRYERLFREWLRIHSSPLKDPLRNYLVWVELPLLFLSEHSHSDHQALSISFIGDYIRQHIRDPVHVSTLAEMAGLSEDGFRKQFAKIYGMTPKQYQRQCRLAEAKWLLSSSDKDLQTLAESIGFSQLHSFSLWFKNGGSPSEWRNRRAYIITDALTIRLPHRQTGYA